MPVETIQNFRPHTHELKSLFGKIVVEPAIAQRREAYCGFRFEGATPARPEEDGDT